MVKQVLMWMALLALALVTAVTAVVVIKPDFAQPVLELFGLQAVEFEQADGAEDFADSGDVIPTEEEEAAEQEEWLRQHRTPLIARIGDVEFRSPIAPADLTGVLFHQASYDYALVFSTELPEADPEKALEKRSTRINHDQQEGEWLDAEALHIWRTTDTTPMDTSIDVGATAGTVVRSPVTGTVVLVVDYMLYDQVPDIRIHIQPDGAPDMDCVLIHTQDPLVKAGDRVEAGVTEISHVRDIQKDLIDVQLSFYTPEGVGGNHTHVQANDANAKGYRKERLPGAYKVED
ncbi:MAG: hypothetical protein J6S63_06905 [Atopobiaceae bacterium]|nr:hypothetical protein [Atopobiaceae bacterium]